MKPDIIETHPLTEVGEGPLSRRLPWFIGLWLLSVTILTVISIYI